MDVLEQPVVGLLALAFDVGYLSTDHPSNRAGGGGEFHNQIHSPLAVHRQA